MWLRSDYIKDFIAGVLLTELSAWFVPLVRLVWVFSLLPDMTCNHSLDLWTGLPVLPHESSPLAPQLFAHVRACISTVELSSMRRSMHHEVHQWLW